MKSPRKKLLGLRLPRVPKMPRYLIVISWVIGLALFAGLLFVLLRGQTFDVLQTKGQVGDRQRDLLLFATGLAVLVLLPVYIMLFGFAWRYRAGHRRAYTPNWDSDKRYEAIWWGIPILIIIVLAGVTWTTSHTLDPKTALASDKTPLKVQVIALQWKWLFIYPDQEAASVNELTIPVGRPVQFSITADAPMNSFWIPQLGGQIYAMSGMTTTLNLVADHAGTYRGMSSNISGKGFADMHFMARAVSAQQFSDWTASIHRHESSKDLTMAAYTELARPGTGGVQYYHLHDSNIFDDVIMKYMGHQTMQSTDSSSSSSSDQATSHADHTDHMEGM